MPGWPNTSAAFNIAKEVYAEDDAAAADAAEQHGSFGLGKPDEQLRAILHRADPTSTR